LLKKIGPSGEDLSVGAASDVAIVAAGANPAESSPVGA
jgi:hypothetical protein